MALWKSAIWHTGLALVAFSVLVGCSTRKSTIPVAQPEIKTETQVTHPSPTGEITKWATPFPTLKVTPTERITPTPAATPHSTPLPYPTLDATLPPEDVGDGFNSSNDQNIYDTLAVRELTCPEGYSIVDPDGGFLSPDKNWIIFTCLLDEFDRTNPDSESTGSFGLGYTKVSNLDHTKTWTINMSRFTWSARMGQGLFPYRWTNDGKGVFLQPNAMGEIDGPLGADFDNYDIGLYYLDLKKGKLEAILPGLISTVTSDTIGVVFDYYFYTFSISPDNRFVAYLLPEKDNIIHIYNMSTGKDRDIDLRKQYDSTYGFFWNPDSTILYFTGFPRLEPTVTDDSEVDVELPVDYTTSILSLSVPQMNLSTILDHDPEGWVTTPYYWNNSDQDFWFNQDYIWVETQNLESELRNSNAVLNIHTGQIYLIPTTNE